MWVGCPVAGEYRRVVDGGEVTDVVRTDPAASFGPACALGGPDMRTLFLATTAPAWLTWPRAGPATAGSPSPAPAAPDTMGP